MKPSLQLIFLLLISAIVFCCYALLPDKPLLVGDWGFRQLPLQRLLNSFSSDGNAASTRHTLVAAAKEPTDTTSQHILLFGDSMVGELCYRMSEYANANGHTLTCVSWVSSGTSTWAKSDTLRSIIDKENPTYVFVSLGSNELYSKDMDAIAGHMKKILSVIGNRPTIWIGPPNWCPDGGINNLLKEVMGERAYFPSKDLKFERLKDGRHPTAESARMWVDEIMKWMNSGKSIHPIKMTVPKSRKCKTHLIIIDSNQQSHDRNEQHIRPDSCRAVEFTD